MRGEMASSSAREAAVTIVRVLRDAGHVAYLAGGCVRDTLLRREPKDYDVATDARPERVRELFRKSKYVGEAFGVVLVRLKGHEIEVATFRTEWGYTDGRRPTHVEFSDARHDAQRRDFTINGLFEDPLLDAPDPEGRVIDYVGGRDDLRAGLIRAIGEPDERFGEDYLRMLRAVRFAARLGFTIEARTARAIRAHARYLAQISRERIGMEVEGMMGEGDKGEETGDRRQKAGDGRGGAVARLSRGLRSSEGRASSPEDQGSSIRARAASLVQDLHLDGATLNEEHLAAPLPTLTALSATASYPAALAAWILDRHFFAGRSEPLLQPPRDEPPASVLAQELSNFFTQAGDDLVKRWRGALMLSNDVRDALRAALQTLPRVLNWASLGTAPRKRLLASAGWADAMNLARALAFLPGVAETIGAIDAEVPALVATGVAPPPWVTGDELIALGRKPGPSFRRLLDEAYDGQLDGTFHNREAALEWLRRQT